MKVAVFSPYGALHREVGILYLVANYFSKNGAEVAQLRCDGALKACGRDRKGGIVKSPFQCARCMNEQASHAVWAGIQGRDISRFLVSDDIKRTLEWISGVTPDALERVEFRGVNLWAACSNELRMRWEGLSVESLSEVQTADVRALYISYVYVALAAERFLEQWKPELMLLSSIHDPTAHACLLQAKLAEIDTAVCSYNAEEGAIVFESLATEERYSTHLVLEDVASMRSDPRTWGPEVTAVVHEVLTYLGCAPDRV